MEICMEIRVRRVLLTFLFTIITATANSAFAQTPQYISGAQSQALGRTVSSKLLNVLDASFNPASLSTFKSIASTISFASTELGGQHLSFGIAIPTKQYGAFAFSYYAFRLDIIALGSDSQLSTQSFNVNTAIISYGQYVLKNMAVGIGGKVVYSSFGDDNIKPKDVGLSASIQYQLPFQEPILRDFHIGFLVNNLIQPHATDLSRRRGLSREFRVLIEKSHQFGNSEINLINNIVRLDRRELNELRVDQQYYAYWGLQYSHRSLLFLRVGYLKNFAWGGGLKTNRFILDYAFGDYGGRFPQNFYFRHFISLSFILKTNY